MQNASCMEVDACFLAPKRQKGADPGPPDGCSVPPEYQSLARPWMELFTPACNEHDNDWGTFVPASQLTGWMLETNGRFLNRMDAACIQEFANISDLG